ncbi:MAG TPA: hypothetical protein DHV15_02545 [Treponema sp.]|uniref:Uncharacterized protein n=1 Tax=Treponema denticola (strain ATCC 35405 / DSM 14222 / CIP 103919 / JCM 8153 / KCTC 15104) TaxID=243275 RepID=Q73JC0_TREDE|nr:hypothetical protein TDE_2655 [Treponema denticola ATCC 35405]HCY94377.1 hypothetical protein [Treponema sp.]
MRMDSKIKTDENFNSLTGLDFQYKFLRLRECSNSY